jgi:hypothetical protein
MKQPKKVTQGLTASDSIGRNCEKEITKLITFRNQIYRSFK